MGWSFRQVLRVGLTEMTSEKIPEGCAEAGPEEKLGEEFSM